MRPAAPPAAPRWCSRGEAPFAFCGLRPPGHHAERDRAMGFCLFNNAAVAAAHALDAAGAERVLILDWDVHHGNGTEAIFADSPQVLYVSIHQWPLYPGTGAAEYTGEGAGEGYTVNLPVPPGAGSEEFARAGRARRRSRSGASTPPTWWRSPPATTPTATTRSPPAWSTPRPTAR